MTYFYQLVCCKKYIISIGEGLIRSSQAGLYQKKVENLSKNYWPLFVLGKLGETLFIIIFNPLHFIGVYRKMRLREYVAG